MILKKNRESISKDAVVALAMYNGNLQGPYIPSCYFCPKK